jgi:hypothetical protein
MAGTALDLQRLAQDWYAAWNAHDLDAILAHYADEIVFVSPFAAKLDASLDGVVTGKAALRAYWSTAFERFPDLRFEPIAELYGVSSVTLHYHSVQGLLAAEVLEVGDDGLVTRSLAHYDRRP